MSREEFKKAFAPLHASEDVLLEVTEQMNKEKKTARRSPASVLQWRWQRY